ncbi:MAG: helix-turn-helix domain-containing protein [Kangiellaceae bacterium]|nr:helix-turn-helix domain-containing protein [Kangiellaceae bacterium]
MTVDREIENKISWPCELNKGFKSLLISKAEYFIAKNESDVSGRPDKGILHVLSGILTPCMLTNGVRTVTGVVIGKGGWLGNSSLNNFPHPVLQMEVVEPAEILFFPSEACLQIMTGNIEIYKWLWYVNTDISSKWLQAQVVSGESIMIRLVYILMDIAVYQGSKRGLIFPIKVSQFQLSTMTGISRSRINEVLKELERNGEISINRATITIISLEKLGQRLSNVDLMFRDPRLQLNQ